MTEFKVGDRVRVYGWFGGKDDPSLADQACEVIDVEGTRLVVRPKHWTKNVIAHAKQCRRLVKKERRRVWLKPNPGGYNAYYHWEMKAELCLSETPIPEWTEFIEVKK